jgi:hypothetical protein
VAHSEWATDRKEFGVMNEKSLKGYVTVASLAETIGINRSFLLKKLRRESVPTINVPVMTDGGVQMMKAVPRDYAATLRAPYQAERSNAAVE